MSENPEDLEFLIHEVLEQLGWDADPSEVAASVRRLNVGLPKEDEFSVMCGWLGNCEIVHKLDQTQTPRTSSQTYQIPDLLIIFRLKNGPMPVLVEVKSYKDNKLSFRQDYFERLRNYGKALSLPVLIAWKRYGMWTLFELQHLKKASKNFNISFKQAMKENLLGVLAGDFAYSLHPQSGVHIQCRKEELVEKTPTENGYTEQWRMVIDDVYFTDGQERILRDLEAPVSSLFLSWNLEEKETHSDTHIVKSFVVSEHSMLFAHMALVRLLEFHLPGDQVIKWRGLLGKSQMLAGIQNFGDAVKVAMDRGIVRTILHQLPQTHPIFLEEGGGVL